MILPSAPPAHLPGKLREVVAAYCARCADEPLSRTIDAGSLSSEALREHLICHPVPTRIKGVLRGSHLENLSFERIKQLAGDQMLNPAEKALLSQYGSLLKELPPLRLSDYIDQEILSDGSAHQEMYQKYRNLRIPRAFRDALGLVKPAFLEDSEMREPSIWIAKKGHHTNLHTDSDDNFVVVAVGTKRFHLFPPSELGKLHLSGVWNSSYLRSPLDPLHPDPLQFPDFDEIRRTVLDIPAGDGFFLPVGWAHFVESPESSFMYNYWLKSNATPFFKRSLRR